MSDLEKRPATYTYDEEASAYYVYLKPDDEGRAVRQREALCFLDEDAEGNVIGIEVVD